MQTGVCLQSLEASRGRLNKKPRYCGRQVTQNVESSCYDYTENIYLAIAAPCNSDEFSSND